MNKNRLPKYYIFLNDINHPRINEVLERFNLLYGENWNLNVDNAYYGYDGNCKYNGTDYHHDKSSFENDPTIITMDEFLEMTEPCKTWTLEEFREGKVAVELNDKSSKNVTLLNQLHKLNNKHFYCGTSKYYWMEHGLETLCNSDNNVNDLPTCSINDIIFPPKQINMDKKLLGYKPKATTKFEWYKSFEPSCSLPWIRGMIRDKGYWFIEDDQYYKAFNEAGVLDIWFDKVYEEKVQIFELDCKDGVFKLEVSKKGIYYRPEGTYLNIQTLISFTNHFIMDFTLQGLPDKSYRCYCSHVNLGCKKEVPLEQLKRVVEYYNKCFGDDVID